MLPIIFLTLLFAFMLLWFHIPWIRQILFPTTDMLLDEHEELPKKAEKLVKRLRKTSNVVTDKERKADNFSSLVQRQACLFDSPIYLAESCVMKGALVATSGMRMEGKGQVYQTYVEGNCHLGQGTVVKDWISVKGDLFALKGCDLGKQTGVSGKVELGQDCSFKSIIGNPIVTYSAQGIEQMGTEAIEGSIEKHAWFMSHQLMTIPQNVTIDHNLIVKGDLHIGEGAKILKSIKCYGDVIVADRVHIHGNLFGEKTIRIGAKCRIEGNLFSQEEIMIGSETEIGDPQFSKSVIAKNKLFLSHSVTIWGKMATYGKGMVK